MSEDFVDVVELAPAVMTLEALLNGGWNALSRKVRRALERDDYSDALAAANAEYARKGPADRDASLVYAVLLVGRDLIDEAMGVLRRALTHHAQDVGLQLAQVEALVMSGDFEAAQQLLEAMRAVSTAEPRHWSFLGDMYLDMGIDDEALNCYREALERGLDSPEVAYRLAQLLEERGELDGTAHYLEMAARMAGDNAMLWEAAAEVCYEVGRVDDAVDAYQKMIENKPYDIDAWFMLGLGLRHLDRFGDAENAFREVVSLNPRHQVAWTQLGQVLLAMGRGEQALDAFRRALDLEPEALEALNGAVMAAFEIGDLEAAIGWADKAVELAPEDELARYNYGVLLLTLRQGQRAEQVLRPLADAGGEDRAEFVGALAVAEIISGLQERAFEHIDEAQRLDVQARWLAAFAEELLKSEGATMAMDFLDDVSVTDPVWAVVQPLLGYLCSGLFGDEDRAIAYARRFCEALGEHPQVVPLMWDLDSWEALSFQLDAPFAEVFEAMLAVVEGRREVDAIKRLFSESRG